MAPTRLVMVPSNISDDALETLEEATMRYPRRWSQDTLAWCYTLIPLIESRTMSEWVSVLDHTEARLREDFNVQPIHESYWKKRDL